MVREILFGNKENNIIEKLKKSGSMRGLLLVSYFYLYEVYGKTETAGVKNILLIGIAGVLIAEINKVVFSDNMDKNITEAYQDVVRYVLDIVKEENNTNTYKYDEVSKVVSISAKKMQEVLDMVAPNFKKIEFCKRLSELQFKEDVEIIISNRSGKKGYGYNETGNKMYYKFRIIDRLMKAGA